jgi:uncharacterized protein GlcG (DUF336 family)
MPTPGAMATDPSTSASLTTSTLYKGDKPQTSATASQAMAASQPVTTSLSPQDVEKILSQAEATSSRTVSYSGLRTTTKVKRACRHHIFVVDRNGNILGRRSMPDAWTGSVDIALGKARTSAFFSSDENALSTRQIGQLSQAHGPEGGGGAGPLWGIGDTNRPGADGADEIKKNSIVTFPGGLPLYKNGHLVGGIGVSGDNVDQDESVAFGGAKGFMPSPDIGTPTPLKPKPVDWFPAK